MYVQSSLISTISIKGKHLRLLIFFLLNFSITYNLGNIPYSFGKYRNFNDKLDDITKNYTYFVPRDAAWKLFSVQYPSIYDALSKPGNAHQVQTYINTSMKLRLM